MRFLKTAVSLFLVFLMTAAAAGCKRVEDTSEDYAPISYGDQSEISSYQFASVDTESRIAEKEALGEYYIPHSPGTKTQRLYKIDSSGVVSTIAELTAGEEYTVGPISPDSSKLFIYRADNASATDNSHCYGLIVNLIDGSVTSSSQPVFEPGTVCWSGNDQIFTANRRIIFFSADNFAIKQQSFQIMSLIENDPDGKYVLTGMAYDKYNNRYIALLGEKPVGATTLAQLGKTRAMIAVINSAGQTESTFMLPDGTYVPTDSLTGAALAQIPKIDSSGLVSIYTAFIPSGEDAPLISWTAVNLDAREAVALPHLLREGVISGGVVYGLGLDTYGTWWKTMYITCYTLDGNKQYTSHNAIMTQASSNRYINFTALDASSSYEMFCFSNGDVFLKAYHTETAYARLTLYRISPAAAKEEVMGALPASGTMRYMIAGIDAYDSIITLSDY